MKKVLTALLVLLCACLIFAGCTNSTDQESSSNQSETDQSSEASEQSSETESEEDSGTYTFTDVRGMEVTVPKKPQKVICTFGSFCTLWYECGGTLIYRKDFSSTYNLSPELEAVPILGSIGSSTSTDVSAEVILEAEPDLVIMHNSSEDLEMVELLEKAGVPCLVYDYLTFEGYLDLVKIFTEITERPDLYQKYAVDIKARVDAVRETVAGHSAEAVLVRPHANNPSFTSVTTMCGSMLMDINVKLISYPNGDYTQEQYEFSMEKLLELDPQFVLSAGGGDQEAAVQRVLEWPGFTELTAYKEGRYRHLDEHLYRYKPNSRYAEAYEQLAAFIYPELFPNG